jgi:hypothetical protein
LKAGVAPNAALGAPDYPRRRDRRSLPSRL